MVSQTGRSVPRGSRGKLIGRIALVGALAAVLIGALALGAPKYLSLSELKAERGVLLAFVHAHPWGSLLLYIATYCLVVAVSFPGALVMTLTGGFLFGWLEGGAAAVAGVSSGAIVMFVIARTTFGEPIMRWVEARGGLIHRVQKHVAAHPFNALLTLRLIPAAPIWLVNIAASLSPMPLRAYALATVIGCAPSTFLYASVGAGLNRLFDKVGKGDVLSALREQLFWPVIGVTALALLPVAWKLWRGRDVDQDEGERVAERLSVK